MVMQINVYSEGLMSEVGEKQILNLDLISISLKHIKRR